MISCDIFAERQRIPKIFLDWTCVDVGHVFFWDDGGDIEYF